MLPPNNMAIRQLSQAEGISEATLHKWRAEARGKGRFYPMPMRARRGGPHATSLQRVLETAALNAADLAARPG